MTALRDSYPVYVASKNKIELHDGIDVDAILNEAKGMFPDAEVNLVDGVKFDFPDGWGAPAKKQYGADHQGLCRT
jgi:phosphomannomutase